MEKLVVCLGCNNKTDILFPSPRPLQNADGTGELIMNLCIQCLKNVVQVLDQQGEHNDDPIKTRNKIEEVQNLVNIASQLGINLPKGMPISVNNLRNIIDEHTSSRK